MTKDTHEDDAKALVQRIVKYAGFDSVEARYSHGINCILVSYEKCPGIWIPMLMSFDEHGRSYDVLTSYENDKSYAKMADMIKRATMSGLYVICIDTANSMHECKVISWPYETVEMMNIRCDLHTSE